jgi:hypothetical protein
LADVVRPLGLFLRDNKGEGDCLFHSVMDCLTDAGQTHEFITTQEDLRKFCTAYMLEDHILDTPLVDFQSFFVPDRIARQLRRADIPVAANMNWYLWEVCVILRLLRCSDCWYQPTIRP